ncbi:hypothetical protein CAP37_20945 [Hydrogenophaga sp. IBVHS1]|nr:hypothetical protein CAP37_20945 [Hydrogenophaga sp. IBVHS1]
MSKVGLAMHRWSLRRAILLCSAVLVTTLLGACSADAPSPAVVEAELRRLGADLHGRIDPAHPGRGTTDYPGNTAEDVPKSYAMVLLAELDRRDAVLKPENKNMAAAAGRWLLDHADENGDGVIGWGVPVAWDAYGDGSVNPASTEYTISTAIVVDALLTWSERDADAPAREIMDTIDRALLPYLDRAMRSPSGLIPYSLRVSDRPYNTFNPAAYLAGQLQRFSRKTQDPMRQMQLRTVADDTMRVMLEHRQDSPLKGRWYWNYSVQEEVANDLPHAGYIIDGIRTYMAFEGRLGEQFDRFAVLDHLRDFPVGGETVRAWPSFRRDVTMPARSYDLGFALHLVCSEPYVSDLRDTMLAILPRYRNAQGQYTKYPAGTEGQEVLSVAEYEAYLYRGVMTCLSSLMKSAVVTAGADRPLHASENTRRLVNRDVAVTHRASAAVPLLGAALGAVTSDERAMSVIHAPAGGMQKFPEPGVPLAWFESPTSRHALFRQFPSDRLLLQRYGADGRAECSVPVQHAGPAQANPILRAATVHGERLYVVYYDNPGSANWLVSWPLATLCTARMAAPIKLPSLEDPAGSTYEMIPALRFLSQGDRLYLVGGTLEAQVEGTGLVTRRVEGCRHVIESAITPRGPAHLCVAAETGPSGARGFKVVAPDGVDPPSVDPALGVPWGLSWSVRRLQIDHARSPEQLGQLFARDFLATQHRGWFEFAINNDEGRIPWSQIYYLNGLMDLIAVARRSDGAHRVFGPLIADVRQRLDMEIALIDQHQAAGRYRTRAFTVDRSQALFAVQTARLLLLFQRYRSEVPGALPLASFESLERDVLSLKDHIEVLSREGETEQWLASGRAHLRWPKGSKFYFDGLPVPFNHQNEWAYAVAESADPVRDAAPLAAAREIVQHFMDRVAPGGKLPATGVWDYWWGRAHDGWAAADRVSDNKPAYPGDKGKAWISFRTIDAMALLSVSRQADPAAHANALESAADLTSKGMLYPLANQALAVHTGRIHLQPEVAGEYARLTSPWELANVVWSLARLAPDGQR